MGRSKNTLRNLMLTGEESSTRTNTCRRSHWTATLRTLRQVVGDGVDHADTPPTDCCRLHWLIWAPKRAVATDVSATAT